jgi:hypothetical protein
MLYDKSINSDNVIVHCSDGISSDSEESESDTEIQEMWVRIIMTVIYKTKKLLMVLVFQMV